MLRGVNASPVEPLWCIHWLLDITACSQEISGYYLLDLRKEAHRLRWQPIHTLYSKLKRGNGREIIESGESSRNQRDQVHFIDSGRISSPVPLTELCYLMVIINHYIPFLEPTLQGVGLKKVNIIFNFQDEVKSHILYLSRFLLPFLLSTIWRCLRSESKGSCRTVKEVGML